MDLYGDMLGQCLVAPTTFTMWIIGCNGLFCAAFKTNKINQNNKMAQTQGKRAKNHCSWINWELTEIFHQISLQRFRGFRFSYHPSHWDRWSPGIPKWSQMRSSPVLAGFSGDVLALAVAWRWMGNDGLGCWAFLCACDTCTFISYETVLSIYVYYIYIRM